MGLVLAGEWCLGCAGPVIVGVGLRIKGPSGAVRRKVVAVDGLDRSSGWRAERMPRESPSDTARTSWASRPGPVPPEVVAESGQPYGPPSSTSRSDQRRCVCHNSQGGSPRRSQGPSAAHKGQQQLGSSPRTWQRRPQRKTGAKLVQGARYGAEAPGHGVGHPAS